MTFEFSKGLFVSITLRNGVGLDVEFLNRKPLWITYIDKKGEQRAKISEFDGADLLLPFIRISVGSLWEID